MRNAGFFVAQVLSYIVAGLAAPGLAVAQDCAAWQTAKQEWESNMDFHGRRFGQLLLPPEAGSADEKLNNVYYDGQWIFQQIGAYRQESEPWNSYAAAARYVYVERYLRPANFQAQGFRRFSHGLYNDFKKGGVTTLNELENLRDVPAFSNISEFHDSFKGTLMTVSREVSYALQANILAERAGSPRKTENGIARVDSLVGFMESHFHQWKSGQYDPIDVQSGGARLAPFMPALSMHALIEWIEWEEQNGRDPNRAWPKRVWPSIDAMLEDFLPWMATSATMSDGVTKMLVVDGDLISFAYESIGAATPAYDLNSLIAFPYAWTARRMSLRAPNNANAQSLMTIADRLFVGNVKKAYIQGTNGKLFNQAYRLSFLYMTLKGNSSLGVCDGAATVRPASPSIIQVQ